MRGPGADEAASPATDVDRGLTSAEVEDRRRRGLGNEEAAPTSRPLGLIIRTNVFTRFNAILGALLAVIVVVGPFQDGLFAIVLVANTVIGIGQELRAKRTLDRLAVLGAPAVQVHRDGEVTPVGVADLVLVMSVNPGFGGQSFLTEVLPKVRAIRAMIDRSGRHIDLEIDGGIAEGTAALATAAGARVLVAGNAVFTHASYSDAITAVRRDGERGATP